MIEPGRVMLGVIAQSLPGLSVLAGKARATKLDFYGMVHTILDIRTTSCNL